MAEQRLNGAVRRRRSTCGRATAGSGVWAERSGAQGVLRDAWLTREEFALLIGGIDLTQTQLHSATCYQRSIVSAPPQPVPPHLDPDIVALIAALQQQIDAQQKQLAFQRSELDYAQVKIQVLEERLRQQRIQK